MQVAVNFENETIAQKVLWMLEHFKNDGVEVIKLDNTETLINKFFELTNFKKNKIFHIQNHGWKYSSNSKPLSIKSYWNSSIRLGVCADWFVGPRLEAGWLSAKDLSLKIKK